MTGSYRDSSSSLLTPSKLRVCKGKSGKWIDAEDDVGGELRGDIDRGMVFDTGQSIDDVKSMKSKTFFDCCSE